MKDQETIRKTDDERIAIRGDSAAQTYQAHSKIGKDLRPYLRPLLRDNREPDILIRQSDPGDLTNGRERAHETCGKRNRFYVSVMSLARLTP